MGDAGHGAGPFLQFSRWSVLMQAIPCHPLCAWLKTPGAAGRSRAAGGVTDEVRRVGSSEEFGQGQPADECGVGATGQGDAQGHQGLVQQEECQAEAVFGPEAGDGPQH